MSNKEERLKKVFKETTERMTKHINENMEKWRKEWNRVILPSACFAVFTLIFIFGGSAIDNLYISFVCGVIGAIVTYAIFYDRGEKNES